MKFKEFAQLLFPIIGAGSSTHAFVRSIFETVIIDDGQAVLDEYSAETFKSYYNGNTEISKLARKISAYIEPEEFCNYIDGFSDAAVQSLCDSFEEYLPNINPHNTGEELAELFVVIIKEAASAKRKPATRVKSEASAAGLGQTDGDVITESLGKARSAFAGALEENKHQMAERIRRNKEKTDPSEDEREPAEAEVVDDEMSSGAAEEDKKTVIHHQTNVIQNGKNNVNVTNNGTMNFNFQGGGI